MGITIWYIHANAIPLPPSCATAHYLGGPRHGAGHGIPMHRKARHAYIADGLDLYLAMTCVYWGAQHLPSGLVSVVFGLNPLITSLTRAAPVEQADQELRPYRDRTQSPGLQRPLWTPILLS